MQELQEMFRGIIDADIILDVLEDFGYSREPATEALLSMCPQTEAPTTSRQGPTVQQQMLVSESSGERLNPNDQQQSCMQEVQQTFGIFLV
jgi:hypothetical protein